MAGNGLEFFFTHPCLSNPRQSCFGAHIPAKSNPIIFSIIFLQTLDHTWKRAWCARKFLFVHDIKFSALSSCWDSFRLDQNPKKVPLIWGKPSRLCVVQRDCTHGISLFELHIILKIPRKISLEIYIRSKINVNVWNETQPILVMLFEKLCFPSFHPTMSIMKGWQCPSSTFCTAKEHLMKHCWARCLLWCHFCNEMLLDHTH